MFRQVQGNGNKAFSFGKSRASATWTPARRITFGDVVGADERNSSCQEVVEFLKSPRSSPGGSQDSQGRAACGHAGHGQDALAKGVAGEPTWPSFTCQAPISSRCSSASAPARVRDLFEQAGATRRASCSIDELDAVGRTPGGRLRRGHDEREQTLNQMLWRWTGSTQRTGSSILAATNRAGRSGSRAPAARAASDRQVVVDMPDIREPRADPAPAREEAAAGRECGLGRLARATPGSSGRRPCEPRPMRGGAFRRPPQSKDLRRHG